METLLQVNTGQTVILGGLMQDELDNTDNSVPGFANLPLIGKAFKSNNDVRTKTELVIFLRPTIITNPSLDSSELKSFKQYLPTNEFPVAADEPAN
jgi:general secretion pathway protein D